MPPREASSTGSEVLTFVPAAAHSLSARPAPGPVLGRNETGDQAGQELVRSVSSVWRGSRSGPQQPCISFISGVCVRVHACLFPLEDVLQPLHLV